LEPKKIIIIHQEDLFGRKISGILSFIKQFIRFAPSSMKIEYIGITSNITERPVKKWQKINMEDKTINFLPLLYVKDENKKSIIPLSAKFAFQLRLLRKKSFRDSILFFHRIEPIAVLKKTDCPKIYLTHADIEKQILSKTTEKLWNKFPQFYIRLEESLLPNIDKIFTVTENSLKYYQTRYPQYNDKFAFQSICIDTTKFSPAKKALSLQRKYLIKKWPSLSNKSRWIIFTGRLQEAKAPEKLVKVFSKIVQEFPYTNLIIIGDGDLKNNLLNFINDLGLNNSIFLLGSLEQTEIADFLRASDVFLLTSNSEGLPNSILEALACGTPVVTTNVGDVSKVVIESFSGEIASDFSVEEICKSLLKVLREPAKYTMENCVSSIKDFSSEKALQNMYNTCLVLQGNSNSH